MKRPRRLHTDGLLLTALVAVALARDLAWHVMFANRLSANKLR